MKMFKMFTGIVKSDFRERMVKYWMTNEGYATPGEAIDVYGGNDFDDLCNAVIGVKREFEPDLGYTDAEIDGTLCFDLIDDNFVIPVDFILVEPV